MTDLDAMLREVFMMGGFTTRCDFARGNAELIAQAACLGLLTVMIPEDNSFGNIWRLTKAGAARVWST